MMRKVKSDGRIGLCLYLPLKLQPYRLEYKLQPIGWSRLVGPRCSPPFLFVLFVSRLCQPIRLIRGDRRLCVLRHFRILLFVYSMRDRRQCCAVFLR